MTATQYTYLMFFLIVLLLVFSTKIMFTERTPKSQRTEPAILLLTYSASVENGKATEKMLTKTDEDENHNVFLIDPISKETKKD